MKIFKLFSNKSQKTQFFTQNYFKMSTLNPNITSPVVSNSSFKVNGRSDCPAYLSNINQDSKMGLVFIQEWWGMNKSIAITGDKFAQNGFRVIIPDLYRGQIAKDMEDAGHLISGLDWPGAVKDCQAACEYLKEQGCEKVGIVGFCMGGALTFASLSSSNDFSAGSPFYGVCDLNTYKLEDINCPVYMNFGELDDMKGFADAETAQQVMAKLNELEKDCTLNLWKGVGHAFMNQDRPDTYNDQVADLALKMTSEFFQKHLQ